MLILRKKLSEVGPITVHNNLMWIKFHKLCNSILNIKSYFIWFVWWDTFFKNMYSWYICEPQITELLAGSLWKGTIYLSPFTEIVLQKCFCCVSLKQWFYKWNRWHMLYLWWNIWFFAKKLNTFSVRKYPSEISAVTDCVVLYKVNLKFPALISDWVVFFVCSIANSLFMPACCSSLCCSLYVWMTKFSGVTGLCLLQYGCGSWWWLWVPRWEQECGPETHSIGKWLLFVWHNRGNVLAFHILKYSSVEVFGNLSRMWISRSKGKRKIILNEVQ